MKIDLEQRKFYSVRNDVTKKDGQQVKGDSLKGPFKEVNVISFGKSLKRLKMNYPKRT